MKKWGSLGAKMGRLGGCARGELAPGRCERRLEEVGWQFLRGREEIGRGMDWPGLRQRPDHEVWLVRADGMQELRRAR